jgi:hypothetical protein
MYMFYMKSGLRDLLEPILKGSFSHDSPNRSHNDHYSADPYVTGSNMYFNIKVS